PRRARIETLAKPATARLLTASAALALCAPLTPAQATAPAVETVTVRDDQLPSQPFYVLDFEDNYLPNVVLRENGAASFEALKAQAVAARSFAYHLIQDTSATFIRNSQADQVYSLGGQQPNPGGLWDLAVKETAGEILSFNSITTAAFYVAGAIPQGPTPRPAPGTPSTNNTEQWVTYTLEDGFLGNFNQGTPLGFQGTVSNPNFPNRGAMSQNGADFQSDNGVHYLDILKYYYGGDIQVEQAIQDPSATPFVAKPLASFERSEEVFGRSLTFAGQTENLVAANTDAVRSSAESNTGNFSQELTFDYDEAGAGGSAFLARHLSGALNAQELVTGSPQASIADPTANILLPTLGSVSFYLKADPGDVAAGADLSVGIVIDEFDDITLFRQTEQSQFQDVVVDGQWHKYEFFLEDSEFDSAFGTAGNGLLRDRFSLDSILFEGFGDATVYLDDVVFDAAAIFVEPPLFASDFNDDDSVDLIDFDILSTNFGTVGGRAQGDANGDGVVTLLDFDVLAQEFGSSAPAAVPEPASAALLGLAGLVALRRRR
ncbi:MAG: SpoIID/LytB domain-containing protein, partial [Planctomycetota bacterium]